MTRSPLATSLLLPLVLVLAAGRAESMPLVQEMALHSMLESTTSVYTTLRDYAVLNPDGISDGSGIVALGSAINWSGNFSNTGWSYTASGVFSGMELSMNYSGSLSGSDASDVVVTIAGTGSLTGPGVSGVQPLTMNALSTWHFDGTAGINDYLEMDFEQDTKIGANSHYGRVKGKEKIICMLDGQVVGDGTLPPVVAGPPVELMAWASSGKRTRYPTGNSYGNGTKDCHLAPVQLTSAASSGKRGIATVSTVTISVLSSGGFSGLVSPVAVAPGHEFDPSNQATVVAVDGGLYADDARNQFRSTGQYLEDGSGGSFSGTLTFVPEPASAWLVAIALVLLPAFRARRAAG